MAGHYQENEVALAVRQGRLTGEGGAWSIIAGRVEAIPAYRDLFVQFDEDVAAGGAVDFVKISDALAAFMDSEWRAMDSPYDVMLRGGPPLPEAAQVGMDLFFGRAGCVACHSGPLLSDQDFHAMGDPQLGPGKAARFESHQRDTGRMRVTGAVEDAYAFRTPMLRNVVQTGPWGHAGGYDDLRDYLQHHADPVAALTGYGRRVALTAGGDFADDWAIMDDDAELGAIRNAVSKSPVALDEADLDALIAFLGALSDPVSLAGRRGIPDAVPSGLPVDH